MSYDHTPGREPRATHYVSLSNGQVYPAQTGLPGYEDDNPADWRVATADEVAKFEAGVALTPAPSGEFQLTDSTPSLQSPTTLTLAEDDEVADVPAPAPQVSQLPHGIAVAPVLPSSAYAEDPEIPQLPAGAVPVTPAFTPTGE